ncbi:hypothetical protein BKA93DRAFT_736672 [Sparassis latifolia]
MLSLTARTTLKRSAAAARRPAVAVCTPRSYSSTTNDNDPEVLELEKQRNLSKSQHKTSTTVENAPGWNEYLASASEAAVKADRSEIPTSELEQRTIEHIRNRHHSEHTSSASSKTELLSNGEGTIESREATYERDEISGPLKGAPAHETIEREYEYEQKQTRK